MTNNGKLPLWAGRTIMAPELEFLDWAAIEKETKLALKQDDQESLLYALNEYLTEVTLEETNPSTESVNERLGNIGKYAKKLDEALNTHSPEGEVSFYAVWLWDSGLDPGIFRHFLREISYRANYYKAEGSPGPRPKVALRIFIGRVREIWKERGGKGLGCYFDNHSNSYKGELYLLIAALLKKSQTQKMPSDALIHKIIKIQGNNSLK